MKKSKIVLIALCALLVVGALVAGILYAVAILCMFLYAMFVLLEMIFCFVAFAKMKQAHPKEPCG